MELEMKVVPTEFNGFTLGEPVQLKYDTTVLKTTEDSETIDWTKYIKRIDTTALDIAVRCIICEESTPMNSNDCRARGVFICDKCKAAILHIRKLLEDGGSVV